MRRLLFVPFFIIKEIPLKSNGGRAGEDLCRTSRFSAEYAFLSICVCLPHVKHHYASVFRSFCPKALPMKTSHQNIHEFLGGRHPSHGISDRWLHTHAINRPPWAKLSANPMQAWSLTLKASAIGTNSSRLAWYKRVLSSTFPYNNGINPYSPLSNFFAMHECFKLLVLSIQLLYFVLMNNHFPANQRIFMCIFP